MLLALAASQIRVLEDDLQRIRHRDGDVVLQFQDVAPRAIEIAGPDVITRRGVDQLHRHTNVVAIATHAALEHVPHAQRLADLADVEVPALELEGGRARCHAQSRYLRELRREFLAQSVTQVGIPATRAHVDQGQHGDRAGPGFQRGGGLDARGRGDVERAPPGETRHRRHQRDARDDDRPDGLARARQPAHDARAIDPRVEHDAFRRDLVGPRQHQDDRQADHRQDGQCRHPPFREPQRLERDLGDLQHDPHADQVRGRDLEDVPAPEFREQVLRAAAERGLRGVAGREEIRRPGNRCRRVRSARSARTQSLPTLAM